MNDELRSARLLRAAIGRAGPVEPTDPDWSEWFELARAGRVLPLLHAVVAAGPWLPKEKLDATVDAQLDVMSAAVRFEHDLLVVSQLFAELGIDFAVLKGAATAHLDYADPSLRQFGDVDLLVDPSDLDAALAGLAASGWRQAYPLPRHHERFAHAITMRSGRGRVELDVHQRIAHRAIGELVPTPNLMHERVPFDIAGRRMFALCASDRLIHAALHSMTSRGAYRRLSSTADVLVLADATFDPTEVLDRADRWKVRALVDRSVRNAYQAAQWPIPAGWRCAMESGARHRDRLVERAYLADHRRPVVEEMAYLRLLHGWGDRARYVSGYFTTDTDYARRNRRSGALAQARYLWSRLRSGSRP